MDIEQYIREHFKDVYRFVYSILNNAQEAEDVTQDTCIKAWKHFNSFDTNKKFKTWILAIARNTAIDHIRKKKAIPFSFFDDAIQGESDKNFAETLIDTEPLQDEFFDKREETQKLIEAIEQLQPLYKSILQLKYAEDLTLEEIAEIFQEPLNTIKSRYRRGVLHLKAILKRNN